MNCHNFEMIVLALARNQLLDASARDEGLTHTQVCARCSNRLIEERTLIAGVRAVATEIANREAPERVEVALLVAFREQITTSASPTVIPMPIKTRHLTLWKLESFAAGILILISVIIILLQQSSSVNQKRDEQALSPAPPTSPAGPQTSSPEPTNQAINREREMADNPAAPRSRSRVRRTTTEESETEVVTEFFALVDEEELDSLDSLQVVRVELPGSALLAVGLPVDIETASEPVKADVILGQDGLARAIRFVR